jgi:beta-xylosidase
LLIFIACCKQVTISNVVPRRDTAGNIMDAHDGNAYLHDDGLYYYFSASYGSCKEPPGPTGCTVWHLGGCGFRADHNVSLYTSPDLQSWTFRGNVFQMDWMSHKGILFGPRVLHNKKTNKWVLWWNFLPSEGGGVSISQCAVAISDTALGPFKVVTEKVTTLAFDNTGDFNLFQDDNGDAYIIYNSHIDGHYNPNHLMSVEKLSDDYLSSLGKDHNSGIFGQEWVEGSSLFKRNGIYYAVFGTCCCYCAEGAAVTVYTATSPLGPYTTRNNLGNEAHAQLYNILKYKTSTGFGYLWQGNHWQSAPDGEKGHDFTTWLPLEFEKDGNVKHMVYRKNYTIDVALQ